MKLTKQQRDRNKVKRILRDAVEIINNGDSAEARNLWGVLSALRGPDSERYGLKQETTAKIRSAIGISYDNVASIDSTDSKPETLVSTVEELVPTRYLNKVDIDAAHTHFKAHYRFAVDALKNLNFIKS